jgi:putative ATP-dependent endonuclease of OLD family
MEETKVAAPTIRKLVIERFRGIEKLTWHPAAGVNVILGGGDVGKTAILEAIGLLLSPTNSSIVSDSDYFGRRVEAGFCIEAVFSLPDIIGADHQSKVWWPWEWNGADAVLSPEETQSEGVSDPVYRLRVRGTDELELAFEVVQPDDTTDHLGVGVRRAIGLVRLGGDDRNDRDLRLVQGSALDRLLGDKNLRARLGQKLAGADITGELKDDARERLKDVDTAFEKRALPKDLNLGLMGGPGMSLNALIGLTAGKDGTQLPLASWGSGTRRLAALEIAGIRQGEHPIIVVDEVERGLEPYRQRAVVSELQRRPSQVFLTTHSPVALRAATEATLWYMDAKSSVGRLVESGAAHRLKDPEAYLARAGIIAEGATEVGFVEALLRRHLAADLLDYGLVVSDGGGNDSTLSILEGLSRSGLLFGGFADEEGRAPDRWARVHEEMGTRLFRWSSGCIEKNIVELLDDDKLEQFITPPDGEAGDRLRTLADRLGLAEKDFATIRATAGDLKTLVIAAATGATPDDRTDLSSSDKKAWRKHADHWFKSYDGGLELEAKVLQLGLWPILEPVLSPFVEAIRLIVTPQGNTPVQA